MKLPIAAANLARDSATHPMPKPEPDDFLPTELFDVGDNTPALPLKPLLKRAQALRTAGTAVVPQAAGGLASLTINRSATQMRTRRPRWLPWSMGGGLLALVAGGWWLMPYAPEVKAASVVLSTPSQQYVRLTASGYVVAQTRAAVASKAAGRLIELKVREGSVVEKDQLIARLDASDVRAAIASARATVSQAEASVRLAEVEQTNATGELKRSESLAATGFLSPQAVDTVQARVNAARANVAAARASLSQTHAQLKLQQVNQDFTEIRAPFSGVVLIKNANVGDMITPMSSAAGSQGAVVTMADMTTLEVEADVSEGNLSKASAGQPVEITLDALPEMRFRGQVVGIVPTVDRTKATVMTKIKFDKLDPRILPEMSAKVAFLSQAITELDQRPLLAVNPAALSQRNDQSVVFRMRSDGGTGFQVEAITVRRGRTLGDVVEIVAEGGTLKAGDKLVLSPPEKLKTGGAVRLASS